MKIHLYIAAFACFYCFVLSTETTKKYLTPIRKMNKAKQEDLVKQDLQNGSTELHPVYRRPDRRMGFGNERQVKDSIKRLFGNRGSQSELSFNQIPERLKNKGGGIELLRGGILNGNNAFYGPNKEKYTYGRPITIKDGEFPRNFQNNFHLPSEFSFSSSMEENEIPRSPFVQHFQMKPRFMSSNIRNSENDMPFPMEQQQSVKPGLQKRGYLNVGGYEMPSPPSQAPSEISEYPNQNGFNSQVPRYRMFGMPPVSPPSPAPPTQDGYGMQFASPPSMQGGYGMTPASTPPSEQPMLGDYSSPQPMQGGYGMSPASPPSQAPPMQGGYGSPPSTQMQGGYGAPPSSQMQGEYGSPPSPPRQTMQSGYGMAAAPPPPMQGGYGMSPASPPSPPRQPMQGGYGMPSAQPPPLPPRNQQYPSEGGGGGYGNSAPPTPFQPMPQPPKRSEYASDASSFGTSDRSSGEDAVQTMFMDVNGKASNFAYEVNDNRNGFHNHRQTDDGVAATGSYSWRDAKGNLNVVDYVADHQTGYRATVKNSKGESQWGYVSDDEGDNVDNSKPSRGGYGMAPTPPQQQGYSQPSSPQSPPQFSPQYPSERSLNWADNHKSMTEEDRRSDWSDYDNNLAERSNW